MTIEKKAGLMFSPQMDVVPADDIARKGGNIIKQLNKRKILIRSSHRLGFRQPCVNSQAVEQWADYTKGFGSLNPESVIDSIQKYVELANPEAE